MTIRLGTTWGLFHPYSFSSVDWISGIAKSILPPRSRLQSWSFVPGSLLFLSVFTLRSPYHIWPIWNSIIEERLILSLTAKMATELLCLDYSRCCRWLTRWNVYQAKEFRAFASFKYQFAERISNSKLDRWALYLKRPSMHKNMIKFILGWLTEMKTLKW